MGKVHDLRSGAWVEVTGEKLKPLNAGAYVHAKGYYVLRITGGTAENPTKEWTYVRSFKAPTATPTGVGTRRVNPVDPPHVECYWDVITNTNDERYNYDVIVTWYVDGVADSSDVAPQTAGGITREFPYGVIVEAKAQYANEAGTGPMSALSNATMT